MWTQEATPSLDPNVVPSVLVRSPSGELVARVLGPPLPAPLAQPYLRVEAVVFPAGGPAPSSAADVSVQKNIPALLPQVWGAWEFYVRPVDVAEQSDPFNFENLYFATRNAPTNSLSAPTLGPPRWVWTGTGPLQPVSAGWHTVFFRAFYSGVNTTFTFELDGATQVAVAAGAPPIAYNWGIFNTAYGPFVPRTHEWVLWYKNITLGTSFGANDLLSFEAGATDLSMFDPDTQWGTDGTLATFDLVGPPP